MTESRPTLRQGNRAMAGIFAALTLALAGCASSYGANTTNPASVGQASTVYRGTVVAVREIQIRPDNSIIGAAAGAVLGGIAGSELGGGDKAQTAGAVGGAVLGGLAGNELGKGMNTRRGFAYTIRFDNGEVSEVVQGADVVMYPGTRVYVTYGERVTVAPQQYQGGY